MLGWSCLTFAWVRVFLFSYEAVKIEIHLTGWCLFTSTSFLGWDRRRRWCC